MHCAGNFVLEFPSINSPILTLTHAPAAKLVVCSTDLSARACATAQCMPGRRGQFSAASAAPVVETTTEEKKVTENNATMFSTLYADY